ncbi:divalent-cation tolerance protein CutA [Vibrio sp.]|nr:divalent-cation tolerance protein CutA [Vibrio sp.]
MSSDKYIVVMTTTDQKVVSDRIIEELLSEKLAACVQVEPIVSQYFWDGKVCESKEFRLIIKSQESLYQQIEAKINELHNYEVPEILSIDVSNGFTPYLNWIKEVTLN